MENLDIERNDIYPLPGPLGRSDLMGLYGINRYDLKDAPFKPAIPQRLRKVDWKIQNNFLQPSEQEIFCFTIRMTRLCR